MMAQASDLQNHGSCGDPITCPQDQLTALTGYARLLQDRQRLFGARECQW
jgi:hypothetical protein